MVNTWANNGNSDRLYFGRSQNHCRWWCNYEMKRCLLLGRKAMTKLDSIFKSKDITLLTKVCIVKAMVFPVVMYGCDSWTLKKAERRRIDAFELWCWRRLLRVLWTAKKIKPVNPKGNQSWIFIGRIEFEAETPVLWPLDVKNWLIGKDPGAGKDLRKTEKGMTEDEIVGWRDRLNGHEFEQALTELNWTESWWWTEKPGLLPSMGSQSRAQLID